MKKQAENYLDKKPIRAGLEWDTDENGKVTLHVENKGAMNRFAQLVFKKPKVSFIHLEEMGSFIWPLIDGEKNVCRLGELVEWTNSVFPIPLTEADITQFKGKAEDAAKAKYERLQKMGKLYE